MMNKNNSPQVRLGDIAKIITGKTSRTNNPNNYGGVIPFVPPSDGLGVKTTEPTITNQQINPIALSENFDSNFMYYSMIRFSKIPELNGDRNGEEKYDQR
jgi:restriction endonuclease S subunit